MDVSVPRIVWRARAITNGHNSFSFTTGRQVWRVGAVDGRALTRSYGSCALPGRKVGQIGRLDWPLDPFEHLRDGQEVDVSVVGHVVDEPKATTLSTSDLGTKAESTYS